MSVSSLRLWQLLSPALPVGGYSYSHGLEAVIDAGGLTDAAGVEAWVADTLRFGLASTDLPVLARVARAWNRRDERAVAEWSRTLVAVRETAELRAADLNMGEALVRLLGALGVPVPTGRLPFACAFAAACSHWSVPLAEACAGFAWASCEAQIAAAVKLVPLGQTAGQRILLNLADLIGAAVEDALARRDEDIGFGMPGLAIASARHETQYSRLFRS